MNKILNGDFSSGFDSWDNGVGGGLAFTLDSAKAKVLSFPGSTEKDFIMRQIFSINEEVVSAAITVWGQWEAYSGAYANGYNQFIVDLIKPDTSSVSLLDTTKTAVSSSGNLLNAVDIKANLDQYGNYELWLEIKTKSAVVKAGGPYLPGSVGWYDNISVDVAVKKYKTVHEILGSSGQLGSEARVSRSGAVTLAESYSTEVYSPTFNYETASGVASLARNLY